MNNWVNGDITRLLHKHAVQRVFLAAKDVSFENVQAAVSECEVEGVEVWLPADFIKTTIARPSLDAFDGNLMMVFRSAPEATWTILLKHIADRLLGLIIFMVTLPLWVFAIIGIKISSPEGSVFFIQERGGKNGRPFKMFKFRTMIVDAEEKKKELTEMNEMSGPVFKMDNDPRIFSFGVFLRKWSIDELPQLINVIIGQMSLVDLGPYLLKKSKKLKSQHTVEA